MESASYYTPSYPASSFTCTSHLYIKRKSIPILRMLRILIFVHTVAKSNDVRRVREPWKSVCIAFGPVRYYTDYTKASQNYRASIYCSHKFRFGRNRDFLALLTLPLAGGLGEGERFNASWWLISPASFHTSSDNRERNTQKWNSNNKDYVRKKPLRHGCSWQMLRNKLREVQCFATTRCKL